MNKIFIRELDAIKRDLFALAAEIEKRMDAVFAAIGRHDAAKLEQSLQLPRVLRQLDQALQAAGLTEITALLDRDLPDWRLRGEALAQRLAQAAA